jgi:hypothetical protein
MRNFGLINTKLIGPLQFEIDIFIVLVCLETPSELYGRSLVLLSISYRIFSNTSVIILSWIFSAESCLLTFWKVNFKWVAKDLSSIRVVKHKHALGMSELLS